MTRKDPLRPGTRLSGALNRLIAEVLRDPSACQERLTRFTAGFRRYSYLNRILLLAQRPEALWVLGARAWEAQHGRTLRKGAVPLYIQAPSLKAGATGVAYSFSRKRPKKGVVAGSRVNR